MGYLLLKNRFLRNVLMHISGASGANLITFALAPLIARIYGPESFGILGSFMATVSIALPIVALAYPIAIVLPHNDREAQRLFVLSIIISLLFFVISLLFIQLKSIYTLLGLSYNILICVPFALMFASWVQTTQQWLVRKQKFAIYAICTILYSLFVNTSKVLWGLFHPYGTTLVVISTLGYLLNVILIWGIFQEIRNSVSWREVISSIDFRKVNRLKEVALAYRDFPLYRAPQNLFNAVSYNMPILMLSFFLGHQRSGFTFWETSL